MTTPVVHIVGLDVQVGTRVRQRCAWCGAIIEDIDHANVAVPVDQDPGPCPTWEIGALVAIDGNHRYVVAHEDGAKLPPGSCALLDPEVTGSPPVTPYDHETMVSTLVAHQPTDTSGCICGWAVLGASHPEHVIAMYEQVVASDSGATG